MRQRELGKVQPELPREFPDGGQRGIKQIPDRVVESRHADIVRNADAGLLQGAIDPDGCLIAGENRRRAGPLASSDFVAR